MTPTSGNIATVNGVTTTLPNGYHACAWDDGGLIEYRWSAECAELPGALADGRTADEALDHLRDLLPDFIAFLRADGLHVPLPNDHLNRAVWDDQTAYPEETSL